MAYSKKVVEKFENTLNEPEKNSVGRWDPSDLDIGTGMVGAPACGDVMKLQIKVNDDGIIEDAKFKTYGCGSAIASSSLLTEWVKGKSLTEASLIKNSDILIYSLPTPLKNNSTPDLSILKNSIRTMAEDELKQKNNSLH